MPEIKKLAAWHYLCPVGLRNMQHLISQKRSACAQKWIMHTAYKPNCYRFGLTAADAAPPAHAGSASYAHWQFTLVTVYYRPVEDSAVHGFGCGLIHHRHQQDAGLGCRRLQFNAAVCNPGVGVRTKYNAAGHLRGWPGRAETWRALFPLVGQRVRALHSKLLLQCIGIPIQPPEAGMAFRQQLTLLLTFQAPGASWG